MIDPRPGLPAHIALLLNENFDFSDPRLVFRKLKSMLSDLKNQTKFGSMQPLPRMDSSTPEFRAVLSGGLDLFGTTGACQALQCRIRYADQIARTVALMSDRVTAHDFFYERILELRSRPTNAELYRLAADIAVLKRLQPLIEAGIFCFTSPFMSVCAPCMNEFDKRVLHLTNEAIARVGHLMMVERDEDGGHIDLTALYEPALFIHFSGESTRTMTDEDLRSTFVYDAVRSTIWDARAAAWTSGSVFSNSPTGISALLSADGVHFTSPELMAFAANRTAELPWIASLTIEQTLSLRDAASVALPQLREFMARRLSGINDLPGSDNQWREIVAELREQAAEVRSELSAATRRSPSLRRNSAGILGLAVSAACLLADGPVSALGGLLGTLGLVHSNEEKHNHALRAKPGYVLVSAKDILDHAQQAT
ncbi:hypothetical protein FHR59_000662 [Xanthomonas arboricola]|uniref:hypothetical protein n=1 Tax=Xanthomonas TaxID=338 RepID=UPI0016137BC4|nr:hypothetical protein [Xanthomonas arboricola]MBB6336452.1 hypothetical protein [Xanthomonas arboricola]